MNMPTRFEFSFEGKPIAAHEGQSVAAALLEAGERCLRIDEAGNAKGAVCGIGVCWECRCSIDGVPDTRACVTEARQGRAAKSIARQIRGCREPNSPNPPNSRARSGCCNASMRAFTQSTIARTW